MRFGIMTSGVKSNWLEGRWRAAVSCHRAAAVRCEERDPIGVDVEERQRDESGGGRRQSVEASSGKTREVFAGGWKLGESYLINHFSFPSMWQNPQRGDWYHPVSLVWFNNPNDCRGDTIINRAEKSPALNLTENQREGKRFFKFADFILL